MIWDLVLPEQAIYRARRGHGRVGALDGAFLICVF